MNPTTSRRWLFCLIGLIFFHTAHANSLRVYYFGTPVSGIDFSNPQAAYMTARGKTGDTIADLPNYNDSNDFRL